LCKTGAFNLIKDIIMKNKFLSEPIVRKVTDVDITIDSSLGRFSTVTTEWGNGEGFTFTSSDDKGKETKFDFTWDEFNALKKAARIIIKGGEHV
jgi:hypothetical protein